jgi:hypothetical protein
MNFYCSKTSSKYPKSLNLKTFKTKSGWYLSLDKDWLVNDSHAFKGDDLSWCKISYATRLSISTNELRDFPIYYNQDCVTNIERLTNLLPTDGQLSYTNDGLKILWKDDFYPIHDDTTLDFGQCHEILFESICENVEMFANKNIRKIYVPAQNGIDTLTVRSILDYFKINYELFELPSSKWNTNNLQNTLSALNWGFTQVQEKDNSVVATGFHGDEWILRNPFYVHILLSLQGKNIIEVFDLNQQCYMKKWFDDHYRQKCSAMADISIQKLQTMLCNDYQIWPIDSTYFFSPLKHKNLLRLLHADVETLIGQVTNAELSKSIIERCSPHLLDKLEYSKNANDPSYFVKC